MTATTRKPRRACIYARVSSEKQGRDNAVSIGEQIADCQKRLAANGDVLVATFIDDSRYRSSLSGRMVEPSAKRTDRPQWIAMLAGAGRAGRRMSHSTPPRWRWPPAKWTCSGRWPK